MLPRHGAFALGGEVDDHLRLLAIEQLQQEIEFVGHVPSVVFVPRTFLDAEGERSGPQRIAADADHLLCVGVIEKIERRGNAEAAAAAEDRVGPAHVVPSARRRQLFR